MTDINAALGVRSHFSIGESLLKPDDIILHAKNHGYKAVALADTMSVSGMVDFFNKADKEGIKAIIGCRLRIVDDPTDKTKKKDRTKPNRMWYPKVFVKNAAGMNDLLELLTLSFEGDHFYYVQRLGLSELLPVLERGNLILTTGDLQSVLSFDDYTDILAQVRRACSASDAFIELCPIDTPLFDALNERAIKAAVLLGMQTLVTYPTFYAGDDADTLNIASAIALNNKLSDRWHNIQHVKDFKWDSPKTLVARVIEAQKRAAGGTERDYWKQGVLNIGKVVGTCEYKWEKHDVTLPVMAPDEHAVLLAKIKTGWMKRIANETLGYKPSPTELKVYTERLKYEVETLHRMGFERYFLLVEDLVNWSKRNGIMVGPGRGSVGGSLVAYLLGITDVDPIRFDLIFERFINPDRIDLPDADLDFMSSRRHEVVQYLVGKYGVDRVAGISNYGTLAASSALRDVGRVYDLNAEQMTPTKFVPKEHGKPIPLNDAAAQVPQIAEFKAEYPHVWAHAEKLEGVMRSYGQHAAGVVVAGEPLVNRAVVEMRKGTPVVNWDKRCVEDWGLVKMDILGLSTLDVLQKARSMIKEVHGVEIDYTSLPLDDEEVMAAFGRGETVGVFQFESGGMRKLLKDLAINEPLTFDDLAAATSLYRPGPMDSGLLEDYVAIKQGYLEPSYEHPNMKNALRSTNSVIVYQEQVMQLARDLAGFTMTEADHLRKAMGKKDKKKMAELRDKWVEGCEAHSGMKEFTAGELFDKIEKFAGYGFNRSHAVEYSIISYWTLWLKVKYPMEYYAASLSVVDKEEKLPGLVRAAKEDGIEVVPPDINLSGRDFTPGVDPTTGTRYLYTPFNKLKGLSDKSADAILSARAKVGRFTDHAHFVSTVNKRECNKRVQEVLDRVGAFASIKPGLPARHPDRLKDQMELMPGLVVALIKSSRKVDRSNYVMAELKKITAETRTCDKCDLAGGIHPKPGMGKDPKFVVITDCPTWEEEQAYKLLEGDTAAYIKGSIKAAGLKMNEGYYTTLVKAKKVEKQLTTDQITACSGYLRKELELLKPPVIVVLGTAAMRFMLPGIKGSAAELAGTVTYLPDIDASVVIGIPPGMIYFDAAKLSLLDATFAKVAELVS